jgi:hypothetical protein
MSREYPPAVLVHSPHCPDVRGRLLPTLPTATIARRYPNGRMHSCYHFTVQASGVAEPMEYPPHGYEASTVDYPGAARPMCRVCMGTHGVLDALVLPPGVQDR